MAYKFLIFTLATSLAFVGCDKKGKGSHHPKAPAQPPAAIQNPNSPSNVATSCTNITSSRNEGPFGVWRSTSTSNLSNDPNVSVEFLAVIDTNTVSTIAVCTDLTTHAVTCAVATSQAIINEDQINITSNAVDNKGPNCLANVGAGVFNYSVSGSELTVSNNNDPFSDEERSSDLVFQRK